MCVCFRVRGNIYTYTLCEYRSLPRAGEGDLNAIALAKAEASSKCSKYSSVLLIMLE